MTDVYIMIKKIITNIKYTEFFVECFTTHCDHNYVNLGTELCLEMR